MFTGTKEVKGRMHTYYQVLLDTRDMPHIVSQSGVYELTFIMITNEFLKEFIYTLPDVVSFKTVIVIDYLGHC